LTLSSAVRSKVLGIDAGERRIGLALSDESRLLATPVSILDRRRGLTPVLDSLLDLAQREHVGQVVVGLPLNADGSEGPQARRAREFASLCERVMTLPVTLWDERLSTQEAQALVSSRKRSRRAHVDDVAAAVILQDYLDAQRRENASC
jgi:putative Holliday junction resolvase